MKEHFNNVLDPLNLETTPKDGVKIDINKAVKWYDDSSTRYAHDRMGPLKDKRVLDVGCGVGTHLIWLARMGAIVTGIDISDKRVDTAKKIIMEEGLEDRISAFVRNAEDTGFREESFDIIFGLDVLMFLDGNFDSFIKETKRILKKGGLLVFSEALDSHPVARFYRKHMAPPEWKEFTHYFNISYLEDFKKNFEYVEYRTFYLTGFFMYLAKLYIPFYGLFHLMDIVFDKFDSIFLKLFPGLKKYCWRVVFAAKK